MKIIKTNLIALAVFAAFNAFSAKSYAFDFNINCIQASNFDFGPNVTFTLKSAPSSALSPTFTLAKTVITFGRRDGRMSRESYELFKDLSCTNYLTSSAPDKALLLECKKDNVTLQMIEASKGRFAFTSTTVDASTGASKNEALGGGLQCSFSAD